MARFRRYSTTIIAAMMCGLAAAASAAAMPVDPVAVLCTGSADGSGGTCGRWTGSSHYKTGADPSRAVSEDACRNHCWP